MPERSSDRVVGVDFTETKPLLEEVSYPLTASKFVEQYGAHGIKRTNAEPITIRELFEPMGDDTFESPTEIRQTILTLMPKESVGRQRYSDRGGSTPEETGVPEEMQSDESV